MGILSKQAVVAEAICSALYNLDFEPMGDSEGGRETWFIRGYKPTQVRVRVIRTAVADAVIVVIQWFNLNGDAHGKPVLGEETGTIPTDSSQSEFDIQRGVESCVTRCLSVFKDVITGSGVAGSDALRDLDFSGEGMRDR